MRPGRWASKERHDEATQAYAGADHSRAHANLRESGWQINRQRVQRLWREEGLRVSQRTRKRRRTGDPEAQWLRAERPNQLWALDYQHDQTADGRMLRLLNIVDEFTREALVMRCERSITADQTFTVLEKLVAERGAPASIRCDNGPELTANALRDWCRLASVTTSYIEPGARWQNPFAESFNARVRDELLNLEEFGCLLEAQVLTEDWRQDFNREHPALRTGLGVARRVRGRMDAGIVIAHDRTEGPAELARGGPTHGVRSAAPRLTRCTLRARPKRFRRERSWVMSEWRLRLCGLHRPLECW